MKHTILAWNNRRILIEYVVCGADFSATLEAYAVDSTLERMQKSLNHKKGDPRWQILPGLAVTTKLPPSEAR